MILQAGGLRVERRCRRLASWVGSGAPTLRERAAALSAAATLLAIERVKDVNDALPVTPMSPGRVREVLARRYVDSLFTVTMCPVYSAARSGVGVRLIIGTLFC